MMSIDIFYKSARGALFNGLASLNLTGKILVPDYICESIVNVIKSLKIQIIRYPITDTLNPDWTALEDRLKKKGLSAILAVHYFGQPFNFNRINKLCSKYNLILIEDNAHGYGGFLLGKKLGNLGTIGISSPRKFIHIYGGGILHINKSSSELLKQRFSNIFLRPILMNILESIPSIRKFFKKIIKIKKDWDNKNLYEDNIECKEYIDKYSFKYIQKYNWQQSKISRVKKWIYLVKKYKNVAKPIWSKPAKKTNPWACPFLLDNRLERNKFLDKVTADGYEAFTWPYMTSANENGELLWDRVACIILD